MVSIVFHVLSDENLERARIVIECSIYVCGYIHIIYILYIHTYIYGERIKEEQFAGWLAEQCPIC
jgi:hypothetical protein